MKILVTGGTVFVSKFMAEYFAKSGNEVYVLNRNTKPQLPNVNLIACNRREINGLLKGLHFDAVLDVNAYTPEDINTLLDELDGFDSYVMISSSAVYPETLDLPFKENDRLGKNKFWGDYGVNKIAAENALIKRVPNAYIVRPPYLYGEYNNIYREAFVFDCAEIDAPFYLPQDGSMPLQFFHVEDLAKFIDVIINKRPEQKVFNIGNKPLTVKEWVIDCYGVLGKIPQFKYVSDGVEQRNYFPFFNYAYELDTKAQDELLHNLMPIHEGLRRAYEWYKNNRTQVKIKDYFDYIKKNL